MHICSALDAATFGLVFIAGVVCALASCAAALVLGGVFAWLNGVKK